MLIKISLAEYHSLISRRPYTYLDVIVGKVEYYCDGLY